MAGVGIMAYRILIMGLPGSGKTTLAKEIVKQLGTNVSWLNADIIREQFNDWDFSTEGRIRQATRMRELADACETEYVIADFVCPYPKMRELYDAQYIIWVDTLKESRFADTNQEFIAPAHFDYYINDHNKDASIHATDIIKSLKNPNDSERYVYIGGDSFCFLRHDENRHWPMILAKLLNLRLEGKGFPGVSWWNTRIHLLEYMKSRKFHNTEYFIFCHTEPYRPLSKALLPSPASTVITSEFKKIREIYYKYIYDDEISLWCQRQWFRELNELCAGRKILHIPCFEWTLKNFQELEGVKFSDILQDLSTQDIGQGRLTDDRFNNHLSDAGNANLANKIHEFISGNFNASF
jgi:adenylylsulfate kinase